MRTICLKYLFGHQGHYCTVVRRCAAGIFFVLFDRSVLEVNKKMDVFRHSVSLIYIMSECNGDCILLFIASIVIMQSLCGIF